MHHQEDEDFQDAGSDMTEESNNDESEESDGEEGGRDRKAEHAQLSLPSSFSQEERANRGLRTLARQELDLRKGQANDALQELRLAIGQKSLLLRTKVRHDKTSVGKTRAWDGVKDASSKINMHARAYERARKAMERLGNIDGKTYQPLLKKDLAVSADIMEESRLHQKNDDTLAWFWLIGDGNIVDRKSWLAECTYNSVS